MASLNFLKWADPHNIATMVSTKYDQFQMYRVQNKDKWTELESYLFATDTTSLSGNGMHDHTTHVPILAELKEELEAIMYAAVMPHEDFLGWRPYDRTAGTVQTRRKVVEYIKNRHALNGFDRTLRKLIQDLVIYGNCFVKVNFVDERKNGIGYIGPKPVRISPYDIVFDPTRTCFQSTPKILRELVSVGEFIKMARAIPGADQSVIDRVIHRRGSYSQLTKTELNKHKQYTPDGFTNMESYYNSSMVEILHFYGDVFDESTYELRESRHAIVIDRVDLLLEEEETDANIYKGSWAEKPDNLWSQGPLDKVVGLNYQINHRENSKSDALDRYIHPDRVFRGDVEEVYNEDTGQTTYLAPEGGGVNDITPDTTVLTADLHQERLMAHARAACGLPPQLMGFRTPGEKTLGEVQTLDDAALRKFLHKAEQFELDLLEPCVKAEIDVGRDNFSSVVEVFTTDDEGLPLTVRIGKADLEANGKLVPMGARRFKRQNQQMNMLQTLANSNLGNLIARHMDTYALAQAVEELGGFSQFKLIGKFASASEQMDEQLHVSALQQTATDILSQPTPVEFAGE